MLGFFRNRRKREFKEGSWKPYLTYTLGEVLLIVVGILIALQVNTWNQNRMNRQEEKRLLGALSEEMELNWFRYEKGKERQENIMDAAGQLLRTIHNPENLPSNELVRNALGNLTQRWFLTTSTSTYDVLVGSGQLGLLSSVELRNELAVLKIQMELVGKYEEIQAAFVDEQLSPFLNRSVDRFWDVTTTLDQKEFPPKSRFTGSYEQLLNSKDFSNLLVELIRHTRGVQQVYDNVKRSLDRIDQQLDPEPHTAQL